METDLHSMVIAFGVCVACGSYNLLYTGAYRCNIYVKKIRNGVDNKLAFREIYGFDIDVNI